jgi:hypothetical protein
VDEAGAVSPARGLQPGVAAVVVQLVVAAAGWDVSSAQVYGVQLGAGGYLLLVQQQLLQQGYLQE